LRKLKGPWIDEYVKWVEHLADSPAQYHIWSAATVVAASLKKHVWFDRGSWKLTPNMFTILVGRPGYGKGGAVNPALGILNEANSANVLSDRLTIEYVLERLSKGFQATIPSVTSVKMPLPQAFTLGKEASAMIFAPELSVFVSSTHTLQILSDLWDAREGKFHYGTRHKGEWSIQDPCLSMLAASAPDWLIRTIPTDAVGGGFTRRVNFVLSNKPTLKTNPWPSSNGSGQVRSDLIEDLRAISHLRGEMVLDNACKQEFEKMYTSTSGEWEDEATASYITTRWAHTVKLAMVFSACRDDSRIITFQDFTKARDLVDSVVVDIKTVFRGAGTGDYVAACDKVIQYLEMKPGATRKEIMSFLWKYCHTGELDVVLATLKEGGLIREIQRGNNTVFVHSEHQGPIP
jgi:Protein of unknown function (DUF3987)